MQSYGLRIDCRREIADIVAHTAAGRNAIHTIALGNTTLITTIEFHRVKIATQGRGFGREEIDTLVRNLNNLSYFPRTLGQCSQAAARHAVKVEVHISALGFVAHHKAIAVREERNRTIIDTLDIAWRTLVVDHPRRTIGRRQQHLEVVLQAILAEEIQLTAWRPANARNVLIALAAHIDPRTSTRRNIIDIQLDRRVSLACLRILEFVRTIVELGIVAHHFELLDLALVETQVGHLRAIGRESKRTRKCKLLLIDPIRCTVDNVVALAVGRQASHCTTVLHISEIEVIFSHKTHPAIVWRDDCVALALDLGSKFLGTTSDLCDIVIGRERATIDRRVIRRNEQQALVLRELIVAHTHRTLSLCVVDHIGLRTRCIRETTHRPADHCRIVLTVGSRAQSIDRALLGTEADNISIGIRLCGIGNSSQHQSYE